MTALWFDGFDDYGGSTSNMLDGAYADVSGSISLTTTNPSQGTHALRYLMGKNTGGAGEARKVLPSTAATIGIGFRMRMDSIPSSNDGAKVWTIRNAANVILVSMIVQADGSISIRRGDSEDSNPANFPEIANSGTFKLTAGIYQHVEVKVFHSTTVGTVELRVDGIPRISATGLNTGAGPAGQIVFGGRGWTTHPYVNIDDIVFWDTAGSRNNDFLGPKSVFLQMPDGDTAQADMTPVGSGTGYGAVNQASPDGDTTYLEEATPGGITELDLADLPPEVTSIAAIMLFDRSRKTDSGDGNVQKSLVSGASEGNGADNPMATAYAFRSDILEVDPATGAAMAPSAFNSAKLKLERTL